MALLASSILPVICRGCNICRNGNCTSSFSVLSMGANSPGLLCGLVAILVAVTTINTFLGAIPCFFCSFGRGGRGSMVEILGIHSLFRSCNGGTLSGRGVIRTVSLIRRSHGVTTRAPGGMAGRVCGDVSSGGRHGTTGGRCGRTLGFGRRVRVSGFIYTRLSGFGSRGCVCRIGICSRVLRGNLTNVIGTGRTSLEHRVTLTGTVPGGARSRGRRHSFYVRLTGGGLSTGGTFSGGCRSLSRFIRPSVTRLARVFSQRSRLSTRVFRLGAGGARLEGSNSGRDKTGVGDLLGGVATGEEGLRGMRGTGVSRFTGFGHTTGPCVSTEGLLLRRRGCDRFRRVTTLCSRTGRGTSTRSGRGRVMTSLGHHRRRRRLRTEGTTGTTHGTGGGGWDYYSCTCSLLV